MTEVDWKSEYSPEAPRMVYSPTFLMREHDRNRASEPYDTVARLRERERQNTRIHAQICRYVVQDERVPRVSAVSITPSLYWMASTEVPVVMGSLDANS
jgi:hypothetical protein